MTRWIENIKTAFTSTQGWMGRSSSHQAWNHQSSSTGHAWERVSGRSVECSMMREIVSRTSVKLLCRGRLQIWVSRINNDMLRWLWIIMLIVRWRRQLMNQSSPMVVINVVVVILILIIINVVILIIIIIITNVAVISNENSTGWIQRGWILVAFRYF